MTCIAIACEKADLSGNIAHSPGHCKYFCLLSKTEAPYFMENPAYKANKAFGDITFQSLNDRNVKLIIARFFGQRFLELAVANQIQLMSPPPATQSIQRIIQILKQNIMPNLNHKGPEGQGPKTGNNQGKCNPENKGLNDEEIINKKQHPNLGKTFAGKGRGQNQGRGIGKSKGRGRKQN
ncbi:MAG: hypothetical protein U9N51_03470 [Bacteroidota bacterium]|nr:hypothetical protein [Bacteroidota bacterium]